MTKMAQQGTRSLVTRIRQQWSDPKLRKEWINYFTRSVVSIPAFSFTFNKFPLFSCQIELFLLPRLHISTVSGIARVK